MAPRGFITVLKMKKESYFIIRSWMPELGLRGAALSVYAVIYGFTVRGRTFRGSCETLAQLTGSVRRTVLRALDELTRRGLVKRVDARLPGSKRPSFPEYVAVRPEPACVKTSQGVCQNVAEGVTESHIIIKDTDIEDSMYNNTPSSGGMTGRAKTPRGNAPVFDEEFERLWELYPRKQGRSDARKAYISARRSGVTEETVRKGIEAYVRYIGARGIDRRFVKQGGNWFLSRCWEDREALEQSAGTQAEPPRRGSGNNRALNYKQRHYTKESLKAMGIDFGEDDDDE
ncbi:MAG: hypothetical protein IIT70_01690 [Clostridia bacterium]|nr:hypothetical protein [Clostridia bacterium]